MLVEQFRPGDVDELIAGFSAAKSTNFEHERPDTVRHAYLQRFATADRAHVSTTEIATLLREKLATDPSEQSARRRDGADGAPARLKLAAARL